MKGEHVETPVWVWLYCLSVCVCVRVAAYYTGYIKDDCVFAYKHSHTVVSIHIRSTTCGHAHARVRRIGTTIKTRLSSFDSIVLWPCILKSGCSHSFLLPLQKEKKTHAAAQDKAHSIRIQYCPWFPWDRTVNSCQQQKYRSSYTLQEIYAQCWELDNCEWSNKLYINFDSVCLSVNHSVCLSVRPISRETSLNLQ